VIPRFPIPGVHSGSSGAPAWTSFTVSEPMYRPDPWVAGTHFVEAPLVDLPDLLGEMLADDGRRERIAAAAAELARHNTLAAQSLVNLIEAAEQAERSLV